MKGPAQHAGPLRRRQSTPDGLSRTSLTGAEARAARRVRTVRARTPQTNGRASQVPWAVAWAVAFAMVSGRMTTASPALHSSNDVSWAERSAGPSRMKI